MQANAADARPRGVLTTVQAGRAFAACAVVLAHAATISGFGTGVVRPGHAGVDFFFVLSGFIIMLVHRGDIGRPERLGAYVRRRLSRIYPPYWAASAIALCVAALGVTNAVNGGLPRFDAGTLLHAAALLPSRAGPVLGVGWTLEHEMLFYVAFGTLILHRRAGMTLMIAWLGWCLAVAAAFPLPRFPWSPSSMLIDFLGSSYHLQFGAGMAVAYALGRNRLRRPFFALAAGLVCLLAAAIAEDAGVLDGLGQMGRLLYGGGSAMVLAGLVQAERDEVLRAPRWLVFLGEASYSIYLVHVALLMTLATVWRPASSSGAIAFLGLAAFGILGGCAMHVVLERPLLAAMRVGPVERSIRRLSEG